MSSPVHSGRALACRVRGTIARRQARRPALRTDERQWQLASAHLSRMLATGRYPTLAKFVQEATHPDADTTFGTGLEYLLDGIAARLAH